MTAAHAIDPRFRALILVLGYAGVRIGDLPPGGAAWEPAPRKRPARRRPAKPKT